MKNPSVADPSVVQNTVEEVSRPLQLIRSRVPGILPLSQEGTIRPVRHSQAEMKISWCYTQVPLLLLLKS